MTKRPFLQLTPLSVCLALALGSTALAHERDNITVVIDHQSKAQTQSHRLAQHVGHRPAPVPSIGATDPVTNCLDGNSAGSLRTVLAAAADNDIIDLSGLTCSVITLTQGELAVAQAGLILQGPAPATPGSGPRLAIDADYAGRAIHATDRASVITINDLAMLNGEVHVDVKFGNGGCVFAEGSLALNNAVVNNCLVTAPYATGGGVTAFGDLNMQNSTVSGNRAVGRKPGTGTGLSLQAIGGGAYVYGNVTITNSTISGNRALRGVDGGGTSTQFYFAGGAIELSYFPAYYGSPQTTSISGTTISGNTSSGQAGGIQGNGNLTISNSTVSGNTAGFAGGLNAYNAQLTLQNSTISFNNGYAVGGVYAPGYNGSLSSNSTIISNNTATYAGLAADLAGRSSISASGDNNLITSMDPAITFPTTQLSADPLLLPLADNGGPTQTHALSANSPAITTGNNLAALATDQRGPGFPRSIGGATDIGAFERGDGIFANGFE